MTGVQVWTGEWICCWISPGLVVVVKLGPSQGLSITGGRDSNWPGLRHRSQLYLHTHPPSLVSWTFLTLGFLSLCDLNDCFWGTGESWTNREWVRFQQKKLCKEQIFTWPSSARRTFHMRTRSGIYSCVFGTFVTSQGFFVDAENACVNCCRLLSAQTINKVAIKELVVQVFNVESLFDHWTNLSNEGLPKLWAGLKTFSTSPLHPVSSELFCRQGSTCVWSTPWPWATRLHWSSGL